MQIKEMEKRTGLSAKAIRYYEQKGLLDVTRSTNAYRNYDDEGIRRLQMIRLLRGLDISVQDIKSWVDEEINLTDLLSKHLDTLELNSLKNQLHISLCHDFIHDLESGKQIDTAKHLDIIEETQTEDLKEISKINAFFSQHSLSFYIAWTLMLAGPILWTYLYLLNEAPIDNPVLLISVSFIDMILITLLWKEYFQHRKEYRGMKKGNWKALVMVVCILIAMFFFIFIVFTLQAKLLIPKDYLMWTVPRIYTVMLFGFMIEMFAFGGMIVYRNTKNGDMEEWNVLWKFLSKHKKLLLVINIIYLYICMFNLDVVTDNHVKSMRWYSPIYTIYESKDVDHVKTGFLKKTFSLTFQRTGDFYYYIYMSDGTKIDISQPNPPQDDVYDKHTYLEIEEYDAYLMSQGIPKLSDEVNSEYNTLAEEFKNRFLTIIRNK